MKQEAATGLRPAACDAICPSGCMLLWERAHTYANTRRTYAVRSTCTRAHQSCLVLHLVATAAWPLKFRV